MNPKARIWRTRTARGHLSPEVTTWSYLAPLPLVTVLGYADTWREALKQVAFHQRTVRTGGGAR